MTDRIDEIVGRTLLAHEKLGDDFNIDIARALVAAIAPDMTLVPREPTKEAQILAGYATPIPLPRAWLRRIYRVMISAAPKDRAHG